MAAGPVPFFPVFWKRKKAPGAQTRSVHPDLDPKIATENLTPWIEQPVPRNVPYNPPPALRPLASHVRRIPKGTTPVVCSDPGPDAAEWGCPNPHRHPMNLCVGPITAGQGRPPVSRRAGPEGPLRACRSLTIPTGRFSFANQHA